MKDAMSYYIHEKYYAKVSTPVCGISIWNATVRGAIEVELRGQLFIRRFTVCKQDIPNRSVICEMVYVPSA